MTGRFAEAFAYNAAFFASILYALVLVLLLNGAGRLNSRFCRRVVRRMVHPAALLISPGLDLVYGLLRNSL